MAPLTEHLLRTAGHKALPIRPGRPLCPATRLAGALSSSSHLGTRSRAAILAVVLAGSAVGLPAAAVAQGPELSPEDVAELGGAVGQSEGGELDSSEGPPSPDEPPEPAGDADQLPPPEAGEPVDESVEPAPASAPAPAATPTPAPPAATPELPPPVAAPSPAPATLAPPAPSAAPEGASVATAPEAAATVPTAPLAHAAPEPTTRDLAPSAPAAEPPLPRRDSAARAALRGSGPPRGAATDPAGEARVPRGPSAVQQLSAQAAGHAAGDTAAAPHSIFAADDASGESPAPARSSADECFHVVRPGESLWSIAADLLGPGATNTQIAREVDLLWRLNAARIRTGDPDLILPGVRLRVR